MRRNHTMKALTVMTALWTASAFSAEPPKDLLALRQSWQKAREQAISPIDKKYADALAALKSRYTKDGNLEAALAVDAELKVLQPAEKSKPSPKPLGNGTGRSISDELWVQPNGNYWEFYSDGTGRVGATKTPVGTGRQMKWSVEPDGRIRIDDPSTPGYMSLTSAKDAMFGADRGGNPVRANFREKVTKK